MSEDAKQSQPTEAPAASATTATSAPRFKSLQDSAEELLRCKFPHWKPKTPQEHKSNLGGALSYIMDCRWKIQYPKLRYDSMEATKLAMAGNDDELCRLLVCAGTDLLATPWVIERYRRAFEERDYKFMQKFWGAAAEHYSVFFLEKTKCPEPRPRFLGWFSVNREMRLKMTAKEILDEWESHKKKKNIVEDSFVGTHREQNFRRWLTQHGIALGHKNRTRRI